MVTSGLIVVQKGLENSELQQSLENFEPSTHASPETNVLGVTLP